MTRQLPILNLPCSSLSLVGPVVPSLVYTDLSIHGT